MDTFRQGEMFPRIPDPTEERVRGLLEPYNPRLRETVMLSWHDLQQRRDCDAAFRRLSGKHLAWWLHGQALHHARELFADQPLRPTELSNGMFALRLRDELLVTLKKLNRKNSKKRVGAPQRSNYLTPTNRDYHDQRRRADFPDMPRVILGYVLLRAETEIEVIIAYPRTQGLGFSWYYELPDQSDGELRLVQQPPPESPPEDDAKGYKITPKRETREAPGE
jgi:hypothetical protein